MDIIDNLKYSWLTGSMLVKLIFVNIGVFLALHLLSLAGGMMGVGSQSVLWWVEMPSAPTQLLLRPWTAISYMFAQYDFFHLLFNMLWLYWFGVIFLLADSPRRMLALYLYCGLGGAVLFMAFYIAMGLNGVLIGSSASVIGIVTATAIRHPDYKMSLMLIGEVSLKWLAIITIAVDFLSIGGSNAGGHVAHIGGALTGALYALLLNRGIDITRPFAAVADWTVNHLNPKAHRRRPTAATTAAPDDEELLNEILDKVRRSGYGSLNPRERQMLFDVSHRMGRKGGGGR